MVKPMFLNESVLRQDMDFASTMNVDLQRFMYRKKRILVCSGGEEYENFKYIFYLLCCVVLLLFNFDYGLI